VGEPFGALQLVKANLGWLVLPPVVFPPVVGLAVVV
jgi:hypothetical protein